MTVESTPLLSTMDRPRATAARRVWPVVIALVLVAAAVLVLANLRAAEPVVERESLVIETVTRGPFIHEISAAGALVAEQPRLISAAVAGRIESIAIEPGDRLEKDQLILRLSNRDPVRQLLEVDQQLAVAEADLADLAATLQARSLESEKLLRRTQFEKEDAQRQAQAMSQLENEGLVSSLEAVRHRESSREVAQRVQTVRQQDAALKRSASAQLEAQKNRLERLRALHAFHLGVVDSLVVRAPAQTTAREILVQEGEWVTEGQRLVRLVEPGRLKAVLQVPESAAHEIKTGQTVTMNARGTVLHGRINRIAAAVEQGTVAAEVRLEGELPAGARPDLSVEGRIEISRAADALSITRPVNAAAGTTAHIYSIDSRDRIARRSEIRFGAASVDRIAIINGAKPGDRFVIAGLDDRTEPLIRLK